MEEFWFPIFNFIIMCFTIILGIICALFLIVIALTIVGIILGALVYICWHTWLGVDYVINYFKEKFSK